MEKQEFDKFKRKKKKNDFWENGEETEEEAQARKFWAWKVDWDASRSPSRQWLSPPLPPATAGSGD